MHTSDLPFIVHIDEADTPGDVLEAAALAPFVAGTHPWSQSRHLERVRDDAPLLPPGVEPTRVAVEYGRHIVLAVGDGWQLFVRRWSDGSARVSITATSASIGEAVFEAATADAVLPAVEEESEVTVGFWHLAGRGPRRAERTLAGRPWAEIAHNYAGRSSRALDALMHMGAPDRPGRLLLLHGPPGTGKTTALRALAHAWRSWAQVDYILDPERLFANPGYLMSVALGRDDDDASASGDRWRLLVLEDCDELIAANAKSGAGQGLARLLNLTDGLLGQGLSVLVCLTTNEPLSRLHPAVVRPGRCLAEIEVTALSRSEASAWLGEPVGAEGATLAQLLARRGDLLAPTRAGSEDDARPLQYL